MDRKTFNIGYFILALVMLVAFESWMAYRNTAQLTYSELMRMVSDNKVQSVTLTETLIQGRFRQPQDGKQDFVASRVDPAAAAQFEKQGVEVAGGTDNNLVSSILSWILPTLLLFGLWAFLFRGMAGRADMGGLVNIGKSKAKVYMEKKTGVSFDDVAGADEAKQELEEIVSFLREADKYGRLGARVPKGILLVGPPGTGKTLLARAIAGEANVPFFSISGSEFVEMFVGVGAARVRDLFEQARKAAPCIIFIDELDALGRARASYGGFGGNDEKEQTLNQLLAELDGFDPRVGIVLLAATNRPEVLDAALLRAGRFDRQIVIDRPDRKGRAEILRVHARKVSLAPAVDLDAVAGLTPGFSGADLANLVNEAAILATRKGADSVTFEDFLAAVERIVAGSERRGRLLNLTERQRVAYHEMGHALAAAWLPRTDPVQKVSIIPRSIGALGYTLQRPTEDRFLITTSELKEKMVALMAGRAAENLIFKEVSTGAADDLAKATDIAREAVTRFGMDAALGQAVLEPQRMQWLNEQQAQMKPRDFSEATAREIDLAVRAMVDEAYARATEILSAHLDLLHEGARLLLARESITPDDFEVLKKKERPMPTDPLVAGPSPAAAEPMPNP